MMATEANSSSRTFMADAMLGRLVRWLRILGYDTAYDKTIADDHLVEQALREDRRLLTRDRYLLQRKILRGGHTLITSDHLDRQLDQLRRELYLNIDPSEQRPFRCAQCNVMRQAMVGVGSALIHRTMGREPRATA